MESLCPLKRVTQRTHNKDTKKRSYAWGMSKTSSHRHMHTYTLIWLRNMDTGTFREEADENIFTVQPST